MVFKTFAEINDLCKLSKSVEFDFESVELVNTLL